MYIASLLALKRGGDAIDDPFGWMASLSREVLDHWEAMWQISPFGEEWKQTARICYWLWRTLEIDIPHHEMPDEDTFMPRGYRPEPKLPEWMTQQSDPLAEQQMLRSYLGI